MSEEKRKLSINCGVAVLLKDKEGMLDKYQKISINCGEAIFSSAINSKLSAMGAKINSGNLQIRDIEGEIVQLDDEAVINGNSNLKGLFILGKENILVEKEGVEKLAEAEGLLSMGTIYYPESTNLSGLTKISGKKKAYPDDAQVFIGKQKLENILSNIKTDKKHIWVSGRLTALDEKAFTEAKSKGIKISCAMLFTYEGFNSKYGDLINCPDRSLVPDGYEIIDKIKGSELQLYGKKIYVDGKFHMEEKDLPALQELEGIIVKGRASLPASAVQTFKSKGKADEYIVFEGRLVEINGFDQYSHDFLDTLVKKGDMLTIQVNGCLLFDKDVTAEDMDCIASLSYNGTILIPGSAKAALGQKVTKGNGFMGDPETLKGLTGQSIQDLIGGKTNGDSKDSKEESKTTYINLATYVLT